MLALTANGIFAAGLSVAGGFVHRRVVASAIEEKARRGDREALGSVLREHGALIAQLCRHLAGPVDGPDVAQQSFERMIAAIASFDPARGTFRTWALGIARNACRDRLRRKGLERAAFDDSAAGADHAAYAAATPEQLALGRIDATRLAAALETLPETMRAAIVLFHVSEASYEEISEVLGVPMGTVMTWLHRGRKRLRTALTTGAGGGEA